ncbi:CPBP family intramembrane glutamic endopeptidase [Brevundimonas viscosa]|uniref:CAAX prenyl protease 2/Lysostaphin resistance protein A-like domain-containing protein n=1 Tax=Brevundimonas viscosa TaxID=871741 RepID=A0A1I6PT04_9CAUL|nr:CPBP family intramembrane glutamic endopeptidase [Brevundimonas viscosa]SFS43165.1 hypothetical protein SAMN05192570_1240 [Brevundimonas viscosa]
MQRLVSPAFVAAHAAAARSSLTATMGGEQPWRQLARFLLFGTLLLAITFLILGVGFAAFPGLADRIPEGTLPDGPLRLAEEGTFALVLGLLLAGPAVAIAGAAALAWRQPLSAFLWPRRRFDVTQFGVGVLVMAGVGVITVPLHLLMGSEWNPPILDPHYAGPTRLTYVLAITAGLLAAAAAEEVVFRGVLLRLTGLITRAPIALCVVNGLLFSAIHLDPDPVAFVARAVSGGVWTWAALRLGGLEFAIGAHLASNLFIGLFWAPLSEAALSQDSAWIDLAPEGLVALITIVFIERLANRAGSARPDLSPRPAP